MLSMEAIAEVEKETALVSIPRAAAYLQETLGQKFTAYLVGLKDPKVVGSWAGGGSQPRGFSEIRLRYAYQIVKLLSSAYDTTTAKAWLFGSNTRLDDNAPAYLIRYAETPDDLRLIIPTAKTFVGQTS